MELEDGGGAVERQGKKALCNSNRLLSKDDLLRRYKAARVPVGRSGGNNAGDDKRFLILTQERFHQRKQPPHPPPPNSQLPPPPRSRRAGTMLEVFHSASQSFTHSLRLAAITLRGAACSSGAHQQPPPWEEIIQGNAAPGFWANAKCKGGKKNRSTRPKNNILKSRTGPSAYRGFHCLAKVKLRLNQRLVLHLRQI